MGGDGSGRLPTFNAKTTVESCLILSTAEQMRNGALSGNLHVAGSLTWNDSYTGKERASLGYEVHTGHDSGSLRLRYELADSGEAVSYWVGLTTTPLPWGGLRWWFVCPVTTNGRYCGRRVGNLYLPPHGRHFACRHCHDLTYTSCQESHKFDAAFAEVGEPMGLSAKRVAELLFGERRSGGRRRARRRTNGRRWNTVWR